MSQGSPQRAPVNPPKIKKTYVAPKLTALDIEQTEALISGHLIEKRGAQKLLDMLDHGGHFPEVEGSQSAEERRDFLPLLTLLLLLLGLVGMPALLIVVGSDHRAWSETKTFLTAQ